jgi:hypothetical protein
VLYSGTSHGEVLQESEIPVYSRWNVHIDPNSCYRKETPNSLDVEEGHDFTRYSGCLHHGRETWDRDTAEPNCVRRRSLSLGAYNDDSIGWLMHHSLQRFLWISILIGVANNGSEE